MSLVNFNWTAHNSQHHATAPPAITLVIRRMQFGAPSGCLLYLFCKSFVGLAQLCLGNKLIRSASGRSRLLSDKLALHKRGVRLRRLVALQHSNIGRLVKANMYMLFDLSALAVSLPNDVSFIYYDFLSE